MPRKKLTDALEGLIIIIVGAVFLGLALSISNNPVKQSIPWVNTLTQAKFFPTVCAVAIIILGLIMFTSQLKGKRPSGKLSKQEWTRVIVTLIVSAYTLAVYFINFTIPTIVYSVVILFFLNWGKKKPWYLLVIAALFVVLSLFVLPKTIQLRLP